MCIFSLSSTLNPFFSLSQAEMSTDSYQLLGMAERGFLPAAFARRSVHGTPTLAILFSSLGIMAMARCVGRVMRWIIYKVGLSPFNSMP